MMIYLKNSCDFESGYNSKPKQNVGFLFWDPEVLRKRFESPHTLFPHCHVVSYKLYTAFECIFISIS